jgi:FlaA1/EpsC-like NDP-sugar epimerase
VPTDALAGLQEELADELVLVTGAGGSIGSELARQLILLRPRGLMLLDRAEGPLYEIQRDIEGRLERSGQPTLDVRFRIGDISNRTDMARLMRRTRPGLILHAAAYKHVPMMEDNPLSAVEVNVGGTLALLDAAAECGVNRFVLVSTDKAVEPANVMGATKRVAELLVTEMSRELGRPWVTVRFGNVLGSSGSVVPIFQKQLEAGEPLTVTHHEMTRYFMTIPEAVHLILQAASLARSADLFVLDMGEPVRVLDLARDVLRLAGQEPNPARIEFTGMRPGEKLHERLFYESEAVEPTDHPRIQRVAQKALTTSPRAVAESLLRRVEAGDELGLRRQLMNYVRGLDPGAPRPFYVKPARRPSVTRAGSRPTSGVGPDVIS